MLRYTDAVFDACSVSASMRAQHLGAVGFQARQAATCLLVATVLVCLAGMGRPAAAQPYAYVVVTEYRNDDAPARQRLLVIDTPTRARLALIPLEMGCLGCAMPRALAAAPDGSRIFVANRASSTVSVVDARSRAVVRSLPIGPAPVGTVHSPALAMSPDGARLYVLWGNTLRVIDARTYASLATLPIATATNAFDILVSPDGRRLYVMEALGRVVILDAQSMNVLGSMPVPAGTISSMDLTRDGSTLYVTGGTGATNPGNVAVYNAITAQRIAAFNPPSAWKTRVTPDDTRVWLAGDYTVTVVDRATNTIVTTFPWVFGAQVMDFTPDGSHAFISVAPLSGVRGVRVVDTNTYSVLTTIPVDLTTEGITGPLVIAPAPPPPPEPPTGLTVRSIEGLTVTLQWQPPASGMAPTSYRLEGGVSPGETLATMPTGSAAPVFTFSAPPGSFYVRMRSVSGSMESGPSDEVRLVTVPAGAPSPPDQLRALVNGSSVWLTWKNTFAGGRPQDIVLDVTGDATTSIPLGLAEGFSHPSVPSGTYTLSVRATNAAGTSVPSNSVTVTVPGTCAGVPDVPAGFVVNRLGSTLFLFWDAAPSGPATTGFVVTVSGTFTGSFTLTSPTISGTVGPGSYGVSVAGTNACGQGAATAVQTVIVP